MRRSAQTLDSWQKWQSDGQSRARLKFGGTCEQAMGIQSVELFAPLPGPPGKGQVPARDVMILHREGLKSDGYFRRRVLLRALAAHSRARRSAVRFFAAASDAFLARAERSSAVMLFAAV